MVRLISDFHGYMSFGSINKRYKNKLSTMEGENNADSCSNNESNNTFVLNTLKQEVESHEPAIVTECLVAEVDKLSKGPVVTPESKGELLPKTSEKRRVIIPAKLFNKYQAYKTEVAKACESTKETEDMYEGVADDEFQELFKKY